jgi:hypothetical protein
MIRQLAVLLLTVAAAAAVAAQAPMSSPDRRASVAATEVHLRGLDTLNGQARDITAHVGETVTFGHLVIVVHTCRLPADAPDGEAMVFLTITDTREAEPRFSGWMFASSPALSALDHPRYDVWVQSCSNS